MLQIKSPKELNNCEWEILISSTLNKEITADYKGINTPVSNSINTIIARVICNKKQGMCIGTNPKKINELLVQAKKVAMASETCEYLPEISSKEKLSKKEINYKNFNEASLAKAVEETESKINGKAPLLELGISKSISSTQYINSFGANENIEDDSVSASLAIGSEHRTGFDAFMVSSKKPDFSKLAQRALLQYDYSKELCKPKSGKYPVIFSQDAFSAVMSPIFFSLKGDNVMLKKSRFINSIGKHELSSEITITDNSFESNNKSYFDMEGNKSKKTLLVKKGVINSFIHDNYTSEKLGMKNTHNSSSMMIKPSIGFNCIEIKGKTKMSELIKDTKKGFLLYDMYPSHTINNTTGAFGQNSSSFYYIENGEVKGLCKGYVVTGNSYEMFKQIEGISKETRNDLGSNIGAIKANANILRN